MLDFMRGTLNGTTVLSTPEVLHCEKAVTGSITSALLAVNQTNTDSIYDMLVAFDSLLMSVYSLAEVNGRC